MHGKSAVGAYRCCVRDVYPPAACTLLNKQTFLGNSSAQANSCMYAVKIVSFFFSFTFINYIHTHVCYQEKCISKIYVLKIGQTNLDIQIYSFTFQHAIFAKIEYFSFKTFSAFCYVFIYV